MQPYLQLLLSGFGTTTSSRKWLVHLCLVCTYCQGWYSLEELNPLAHAALLAQFAGILSSFSCTLHMPDACLAGDFQSSGCAIPRKPCVLVTKGAIQKKANYSRLKRFSGEFKYRVGAARARPWSLYAVDYVFNHRSQDKRRTDNKYSDL